MRRTIVRYLLTILAVLVLFGGARQTVHADNSVPAILRDVGFNPRLGATVPGELTFADERGNTVRLADYLGGKPTILTLNDFECPNLCSLMLDDLAREMNDLPFQLGVDYRVVTVSIDPRDTSAIASMVKDRTIRGAPRLGAGLDWHFLTGDPASVTRLAQAVGFQYAYDPRQIQFAHPSGLIVLTPDGKIARYLYGIDFAAPDMRFALIDASSGTIGSPADQLLLTCYHYDASLGRYSGFAFKAVQAGGLLTLAFVVVGLFVLWRRDPGWTTSKPTRND